jgi:predicted DNA-binding transcriptional regulator AlpA
MTDPRPSALPANLPPRLLSLDQAAEYCGLGVTSFLLEVSAGTYPGPVQLTKTRRRVWDIRALDAAIDRATGAKAGSDDWEARKQAWQDRRKGRAEKAG